MSNVRHQIERELDRIAEDKIARGWVLQDDKDWHEHVEEKFAEWLVEKFKREVRL